MGNMRHTNLDIGCQSMKIKTIKRKDFWFSIALLVPTIFLLFSVVLYPLIKGIVYSFFEYTIMNYNYPQWNNFKNYLAIFDDAVVFRYLFNTLMLVLFVLISNMFIGFFVASMINSESIKTGKNVIRGLFLLPWIVPQIVVSVVFAWILQPQYGVFNFLLKSFGFISEEIAWLSVKGGAMFGIVIAIVWKTIPISIIMILAGLQSVPQDLIEAGKVEGAGTFRLYLNIIIPYIRSVLATVALITIIENFQLFTIIWVMTEGGPVNSTTTLSIASYREAFVFFDLGKGQAIGVVWMFVLSAFAILYNRNLLKNEAN